MNRARFGATIEGDSIRHVVLLDYLHMIHEIAVPQYEAIRPKVTSVGKNITNVSKPVG